MRLPARRVMVLSLLLGACGRGESTGRDSTVSRSAAGAAPAVREVPYDPASPRARPAHAAQPVRAATPTPVAADPAHEGTPLGDPQAIVRDYYAAIRAHDFLRAYRMWQASGQTGGRSFAKFEAGFDSTESVDARVGAPGRTEGAAGSVFVTVPVDVSARLRNGTAQRFSGSYTLRRVNVPGASAAQRGWHLYAASIRQVR
jgi:hypothetical protein